jgi:hypothetical protein
VVEANEPQLPVCPPWKWQVFSLGCVSLAVLIVGVGAKGAGTVQLLAMLASTICSTVLSVIYIIGRLTFWSEYDQHEMGVAFGPSILGAVVGVGFIGVIVLAGLSLQ